MDRKRFSGLLYITFLFGTAINTTVFAQHKQVDDPLLKIYREAAVKINDLVHTKLDVRFDYKKRYLYGKEWVTIKPHMYATDSLRLDAKGMDIKNISIVKNDVTIPLKFKYDSLTLAINLDRTYQNSESYTIYIDYTAKPDQLKSSGSAAINEAKGLYFINPDGNDKTKPIQIWTQGETESSSAWFPTIDKPNQKTTEEISMTVPAKYVTLSNGRLDSQKLNADSTRTDTWKMELPHAPYLFMMAVGDFKIYKDKWRDKEVNYYLEPKYFPYAKDIFGYTPEVMEFYSKTLGVDFPWNKYSQIVVRDYVSGAMENTTATLLGDYVQSTKREQLDASPEGEATIVHELFHQWFGDYVTAESWSNLTVNESFADFSEALWFEHRYGKDAGDEHSQQALQSYLNSPEARDKNLVRYYYHDKEDVLDVVTYQKGGRILNMLRNYLGDEAFFKGLNIYLKQNAFKTGEAQQVRIALEQASGRDLNWFFNQWYYSAGHPELKITYNWDDAGKKQYVYLQQTQPGQAFILPMAVDIYAEGKKKREQIWMRDKADTLVFKLDAKPNLVNVDADKTTLAKKTDIKTLPEYAFQYANAPLYLDRYEAIDTAIANQNDKYARIILTAALKDKYYGLRIKAIKALDLNNGAIKQACLPILLNLAKNDEKTLVQAAALQALGDLKDQSYMPLFKQAIASQSYAVQGAALNGIIGLNTAEAIKVAKTLEGDARGNLTLAIATLYINNGTSNCYPFVVNAFNNAGIEQKLGLIQNIVFMLPHVNDSGLVKTTVNDLKSVAFHLKSYGLAPYIINILGDIKNEKNKLAKTSNGLLKDEITAQCVYISTTIDEIRKNEGQ